MTPGFTSCAVLQVGFYDIVALPLFQSFAQAFEDATPLLDSLKDNYKVCRGGMQALVVGHMLPTSNMQYGGRC